MSGKLHNFIILRWGNRDGGRLEKVHIGARTLVETFLDGATFGIHSFNIPTDYPVLPKW